MTKTNSSSTAQLSFAEKRKKQLAHKKNKKSKKTQSTATTPSNADLAMLFQHYQSGYLREVCDLASQITKRFPDHGYSWKVLGIVLTEMGKFDEALAVNLKSVQLMPQDDECQNILGINFRELDRLDEAESCFRRSLRLKDDSAKTHSNLGLLLQEMNRLEESEKSCNRAILIDQNYAEGYINLGITLHHLNRLSDAEINYKKAISLDPTIPKAYNNLALTLIEMGNPAEAEVNCRQAIIFKPDYDEAHNHLGMALHDLGRLAEAEASYKQAIAINHKLVNPHVNLGFLFAKRKQYDKAKEYYNNARPLIKDIVDIGYNLAGLYLALGEFSSGFELYETRYHPNRKDRQAIPPKISTPQYRGKDLGLDIRGKHLLICSEQGVGDEAMFASVLPELAIVMKQDPNTRITLACEPRLVELFNRSFDFLTAIPKPENHEYKTLEKELDYWIFIGSLPKLYRNKIEDFHNNQPYLVPDQSLVNVWNTRFNTLPHKINIGISWRGGRERTNQVERSLSLEKMRPILSKVNQNANIINLQYGDHQQEIQSFTEKTGITIFDWEDHDPIKDLNNFTAQISALDLVISIDNSTVHFSGAVGTEAYVLLPFNQDWRWLDHSTDSYWYPNLMTLFRQHSTGVWDDVLNDVSNALDKNSMRSS